MAKTPIDNADTYSLILSDGSLQEVDSGEGGGGTGGEVTVTNFPATQPVSGTVTATGPLTNAQLVAVTGTAAQTAVTTDPAAANQTTNAILRGILAELKAQTAVLNTIAANTTPP